MVATVDLEEVQISTINCMFYISESFFFSLLFHTSQENPVGASNNFTYQHFHSLKWRDRLILLKVL